MLQSFNTWVEQNMQPGSPDDPDVAQNGMAPPQGVDNNEEAIKQAIQSVQDPNVRRKLGLFLDAISGVDFTNSQMQNVLQSIMTFLNAKKVQVGTAMRHVGQQQAAQAAAPPQGM